MTHDEVAAAIEDAIGTPGRLRALLGASTPEGDAMRAHLADCAECSREADGWQAADEALVAVAPPTMVAPPGARARILANVVAVGVARSPDRVLGATASPGAGPAPAAAPATRPVPAAGAGHRTASIPTPATAPPNTVASEVPPETGRRGLRALSGGRDRDGVGFRVFLAVAAAAVFLFALGAALGGPLGLTSPATVPDTTARAELAKVAGRFADLLQQPGAVVAPLTDAAGEPAGAVVLAPADTRLMGVVTRALPRLDGDRPYVCVLVRGDERFAVGRMTFADDPTGEGEVAYWIAPLGDDVPLDVGAPGDMVNVYVEGETGGDPILTTTF